MSQIAPIHSAKESDPKVYHNNSACTERNNIEDKNKRTGTGGRRLCNHCESLNRQGK